MTEQYRPNLGDFPDETAKRDATHIAVVPLIAAVDMAPGEKFGLDKDPCRGESYYETSPQKLFRVAWPASYKDKITEAGTIGVIDPFLKEHVQKGQTFWGMLLPNTITDLRHVWSHPGFTSISPRDVLGEAKNDRPS